MLASRPVALGMDSHVHPSKTPGRIKSRPENAVPMTVHGKGKEIILQTPYPGAKQANGKAPMTTQAPGKHTVQVPKTIRVLGDKTPFPNRSNAQKFETPGPQKSKFSVLSFLEPKSQLQNEQTPESSSSRPSSARKQDRIPRSANKLFVTPVNNGNHWDVSDLSISVPEANLDESLDKDDYDEIEYMPPNNLHLLSEPAVDIELPDYKKLGKELFDLAHTCQYGDVTVAEIEIDEKDLQFPGWDLLPTVNLDVDVDDPFYGRRELKCVGAQPQTVPAIKSTNTRRTALLPPSRTVPPPLGVTKASSNLKATKTASASTLRSQVTTTPVTRGAPIKSNLASASSRPISNRQPASVVGKATVTGISRTASSSKLVSKSTVSSAPSRPATSAAMRSRVPSVSSSTIVRRPTTSASQYKSATPLALAARRPVLSRVSKRTNGQPQHESIVDVISLGAGTGVDVFDDFRFDV